MKYLVPVSIKHGVFLLLRNITLHVLLIILSFFWAIIVYIQELSSYFIVSFRPFDLHPNIDHNCFANFNNAHPHIYHFLIFKPSKDISYCTLSTWFWKIYLFNFAFSSKNLFRHPEHQLDRCKMGTVLRETQ